MTFNVAIAAFTFVAVSGSTASSGSTTDTAWALVIVAANFGVLGNPCESISEFVGEAGGRFRI